MISDFMIGFGITGLLIITIIAIGIVHYKVFEFFKEKNFLSGVGGLIIIVFVDGVILKIFGF